MVNAEDKITVIVIDNLRTPNQKYREDATIDTPNK